MTWLHPVACIAANAYTSRSLVEAAYLQMVNPHGVNAEPTHALKKRELNTVANALNFLAPSSLSSTAASWDLGESSTKQDSWFIEGRLEPKHG